MFRNMQSLLSALFLSYGATTLAQASSNPLPNIRATYGSSPAPFAIDVEPRFIDDVRQRVTNARLPIPPGGYEPDYSEGPTLANFTRLRDYWLDHYDWFAEQASINSKLKQFTTTVQSPNSNYTHDVPLHFVHHRSERADAIPLLFVHGWPGSFLEVTKIIDLLTNPPNSSVPAFHVVAPSIPGFGFSPAPSHNNFGTTEAGHSFHALMQQLNYTRYVYQGGDIGGWILRHQAASYPDQLVTALSNFWIQKPNDTDLARYAANETSPGETTYIRTVENYIVNLSGYRVEQQTQPLTLGYLASDSPLGFALWIYALMRLDVEPGSPNWTPGEIITWSLMYTIQGPLGGFRMYRGMFLENDFHGTGFGTPPFVTQPVGVTQRPYDFGVGLPLEWMQRGGNVKAVYVHDHGGHFAAYRSPNSLVDDIYRWFGDRELSGTSVFY
jgi:pimeloyl-ACP methyl ester carboxylesterase